MNDWIKSICFFSIQKLSFLNCSKLYSIYYNQQEFNYYPIYYGHGLHLGRGFCSMHLLCLEASTYCSLFMPTIVSTIGRVVCSSCYFDRLCESTVFESPSRDHRPCLLKLDVWIFVEGPSTLFAWLCLSSAYYERGKTLTKVYLICKKKVVASKLKHVPFFTTFAFFFGVASIYLRLY